MHACGNPIVRSPTQQPAVCPLAHTFHSRLPATTHPGRRCRTTTTHPQQQRWCAHGARPRARAGAGALLAASCACTPLPGCWTCFHRRSARGCPPSCASTARRRRVRGWLQAVGRRGLAGPSTMPHASVLCWSTSCQPNPALSLPGPPPLDAHPSGLRRNYTGSLVEVREITDEGHPAKQSGACAQAGAWGREGAGLPPWGHARVCVPVAALQLACCRTPLRANRQAALPCPALAYMQACAWGARTSGGCTRGAAWSAARCWGSSAATSAPGRWVGAPTGQCASMSTASAHLGWHAVFLFHHQPTHPPHPACPALPPQEVDAAVAADPRGLGGLLADKIKAVAMTSPACCEAAEAAAGGAGAGAGAASGWAKELVIDGAVKSCPLRFANAIDGLAEEPNVVWCGLLGGFGWWWVGGLGARAPARPPRIHPLCCTPLSPCSAQPTRAQSARSCPLLAQRGGGGRAQRHPARLRGHGRRGGCGAGAAARLRSRLFAPHPVRQLCVVSKRHRSSAAQSRMASRLHCTHPPVPCPPSNQRIRAAKRSGAPRR